MNIKIENVTKTIKGKRIIDHVDMMLYSGMVYGLAGEHGSGKTMLMRLIAGLIYPTEGTVTVDHMILGTDISFPKRMGFLIEKPVFLDSYSGKENLQFLTSVWNQISDQQIDAVMEKVGLEPDFGKKYREYSPEMKQRLGIAAAIMEEPELLLLDEPATTFDASGFHMLKQIVREQKEKGALILVSGCDVKMLRELSDVIYEVYDGKIQRIERRSTV